MNIHHLAHSIGKDQDGHLNHPGLTFPKTSPLPPKAPIKRNIPPETTTPPPPDSYTTATAAALINIDKSHISHYLQRHNITPIRYKHANYWNKTDIDTHILTLTSTPTPAATIPPGHITMQQARHLTGASRTTLNRHIQKHNIPTQKAKIQTGSKTTIILTISKQDLLHHLPKIQNQLRNKLLKCPTTSHPTKNKPKKPRSTTTPSSQ